MRLIVALFWILCSCGGTVPTSSAGAPLCDVSGCYDNNPSTWDYLPVITTRQYADWLGQVYCAEAAPPGEDYCRSVVMATWCPDESGCNRYLDVVDIPAFWACSDYVEPYSMPAACWVIFQRPE